MQARQALPVAKEIAPHRVPQARAEVAVLKRITCNTFTRISDISTYIEKNNVNMHGMHVYIMSSLYIRTCTRIEPDTSSDKLRGVCPDKFCEEENLVAVQQSTEIAMETKPRIFGTPNPSPLKYMTINASDFAETHILYTSC